MASMTGEVRNAMRDLLADIVGLKHEVQASITAASLRKARLAESETSVRDDIQSVKTKLQSLLKTIEERANKSVGDAMKLERERINGDILFLEEQHKRLEETEEEVRSKTSNISLKVMKEGREVWEASRDTFEQYKASVRNTHLQFVLHAFLSSILEQIETFTMGEVKIISQTEGQEDDEFENENKYGGSRSITRQSKHILKRSKSLDPVKTSFSRSNSLDPMKASFERSKSSQMLKQQPDGTTSRAPSRNAAVTKTSSTPNSRPQSKQSRGMPDLRKNKSMLDRISENAQENEILKPIAGLKATFVKRTFSEPLINLVSKERSIFVNKQVTDKDTLHPEIGYRETLHTKVHKEACYITGIAVLQNRNVVVCDNVHDSLQLYDPESKQVSELECEHPWGVTAVSDSAVAVTLHYDHKVLLVKANDHLERLTDKDIKLKCKAALTYDLKYYDYRLYVLCINGDIHVMDIKGKEYSLIRTGMLPSVLKFFDVDLAMKLLIVSGDNGVACLNLDGLHLWKFHSKGKFVSTGVAISKGSVLVCDWENHCLLQIYEKGNKATTVVGENLEKPVAISYSMEHQLFFISQGDYEMETEKTRAIKVFELT